MLPLTEMSESQEDLKVKNIFDHNFHYKFWCDNLL